MKYRMCLLLSLLPSVALAAPGPAATYLMNEPLSMMDYGLIRLKEFLEEYEISGVETLGAPAANTAFDAKQNEIQLKYIFYPRYEMLKQHDMNDLCRIAITQIRSSFGYEGIESAAGRDAHRANGEVSSFFQHNGYNSKGLTEAVDRGIEDITRITVSANTSETNKPPMKIHSQCTLMLTDGNIYFEDKPKK